MGRALAVLQRTVSSLLVVIRWVRMAAGLRRASSNVVVETGKKRPLEPAEAKTKKKGKKDHPENQAWLDRGRLRLAAPITPAVATLPRSPREQIFVADEANEIVERFARYCRIAASNPRATVCHMCIFEEEFHPNGLVSTSDAWPKHKGESVWCREFDCTVKAHPGRDLSLHIHFCYERSSGWWLH